MALHKAFPLLKLLENDPNLQMRIDATEARVQRTFELPARRRLYLDMRNRLEMHPLRPEEALGTWRI